MKKRCIILTLCCGLLGCGGDPPSFEGVWSGSFTSLINDCPFSVASDINPLFPMAVTVDANEVFTVVAVDSSTATGGQGDGESISFLAQAPVFGNYGSIAPYSCSSSLSTVGFLDDGEDKARVSLTVAFTDCTTPESTDSAVSCGVIYYGDAQKIG